MRCKNCNACISQWDATDICIQCEPYNKGLLAELAKAKVMFQQKALLTAMGIKPEQEQQPVEKEK